jgi:hypothetical protein
MQIAIVSKFGHFECLGFLLESLKDFDITIFVKDHSDKFNWIGYFKMYYKFKVHYHLNINVNEFYRVIKLTSNDECLYSEDTISLVHLNTLKHSNNNSKKFISLTPYILGDDVSYMFPIFKPDVHTTYKNSIIYVGHCKNIDIDDDTSLFISNNLDYHFTFIVWGDTQYGNVTKHKNASVLHHVESSQLVNIINESKYVLSKKYINRDRFSGVLSLAMSFNKPLIIDRKTADAYHLPGFIFYKNYSELGSICTISDEEYNTMIDKIKECNKDTVCKNKEIMTKITGYIPKPINVNNTILLVEPRMLHELPDIIKLYHVHLPDWNVVFYCGKNTKSYWESKLENYVELRELDVDNFETASKYSFFLKQKDVWESLYGDFVLTIQADTMIMSIAPYDINYFIKLNKSYIGSNMDFRWRELKREGINFNYYNFNGGLSLRKRNDMIKIIEHFPPKLFDDKSIYSSQIETDPEDVYFTIGCYKLGLPVGDDEESSHFSIHKIYKHAFFGSHQPSPSLKNEMVTFHPELSGSYLLK